MGKCQIVKKRKKRRRKILFENLSKIDLRATIALRNLMLYILAAKVSMETNFTDLSNGKKDTCSSEMNVFRLGV